MNRKIGFSTGVMFHAYNAMSANIINISSDMGCATLELNVHTFPEHVNSLLGLSDDNILFRQQLACVNMDSLSCHLPCNIYYISKAHDDAMSAKRSLQNITVFSGVTRFIDYVVVHPDLVVDWEIFDDFPIPVAIENMDNRKKTFRTLHDLRNFFQKYPQFKLVFDVQHWVVNDGAISDISAIIVEFGDRLAGIHLSGVGSDKYHVPVCRTRQQNLVESLQNLPAHIPIILEGVCEDVDEMKREFAYITNILR